MASAIGWHRKISDQVDPRSVVSSRDHSRRPANCHQAGNVELELVPLSDRLREVHHEELGLGTELHASSPEVADVITVQLNLNLEEIAEQLEVGSHPKEAFTESHEFSI